MQHRAATMIAVGALTAITTTAAAWTPPVGIPTPPFGIDETVEDIYGPDYYTYYVDNTHPAATDTNNQYGTRAKPRMTLPFAFRTTLHAGDVLLVNGGPYTMSPSYTRETRLTALGTVAQPIFIRGEDPNNRPKFDKMLVLDKNSSYLIIENFDFDAAGSTTGAAGVYVWGDSDYIAVRHCEFQNGDGGMIVEPSEDSTNEDIVIYDNLIHHKGDYLAEFDQDRHGVVIAVWSPERGEIHRVWVVDNEMHHCSGNGMQINARFAHKRLQLQHVYVGRNVAHHNKQAGLWTKQAEHVIFSQNRCYGAYVSDSSPGDGMGGQYGPGHVWFIFNEVYDSNFGIRMSDMSGSGENIYLLGNVIYNIHHRFASGYQSTNPWAPGKAISIWGGGGGPKHVVANTIFDVDGGINLIFKPPSILIANNIIDTLLRPHDYHIALCRDDTASVTDVYNCFLGNDPVPPRIRWGFNTTGLTIQQFQTQTGEGQGLIEGDPMYANVPVLCASVPFFEIHTLNGTSGEVDIDGAIRTTLTGSVDFEQRGMTPTARVQIVSGTGIIKNSSNGYCANLKVHSVSGNVITLVSDVTDTFASDINFSTNYYPPTQTDLYVADTAGFDPGDIVEYRNDGVARAVQETTTDSLGNKIVLTESTKLPDNIAGGGTIANWKANTNIKEDFHLLPGSGAIDSGADMSAIFNYFQSLYGLSIAVDFDGNPRPQGGGTDMGAYELTSTVAGRYVFYNNSPFDGNNPAAGAADDAAIATDKTALLGGGTATFANYTSYASGINGVMIDIPSLPGTPTASDFEFKVGNDSSPGGWATAAAPTSITVRAGAGAGGSDRVTLIWADNVIEAQWLEVTVKTSLGMPVQDVFYFGNAIGETGNSPADARVTPTDAVRCRNNPHTGMDPAGVTDAYDFDRDTNVGPADEIILRDNATSSMTALQLITVP